MELSDAQSDCQRGRSGEMEDRVME
jgi:hypothetical protein